MDLQDVRVQCSPARSNDNGGATCSLHSYLARPAALASSPEASGPRPPRPCFSTPAVHLSLQACDAQDPSEDAIVVTVPYPQGADYDIVHAAINACLDKRPTLPIVSTNTDTYSNERVLSYVGSDNYAMGKVCATAAFTDDDKAPSRPEHTNSSTRPSFIYTAAPHRCCAGRSELPKPTSRPRASTMSKSSRTRWRANETTRGSTTGGGASARQSI